MFRRKKKEEEGEPVAGVETSEAALETSDAGSSAPSAAEASADHAATTSDAPVAAESAAGKTAVKASARSGNRVQKVGIVSSDKMTNTVVVRVDRLVLHRKYRRYVRRTSKFMAHDELGSTTGDRVRIVETRPLSARKRWRVVEIVQKAAK
jgi:small subunit ribosomal protein S17